MKLSEKSLQRLFAGGHVAKGSIYFLVGTFALATVIGAARSSNGPKAIIDWVSGNPFGQLILGLLGAGLAAYALWRFYLAAFDPAEESDDNKGKVKRIGWVVSGLAYAGLAVYAFQRLISNGGSKETKKDLIAALLEQSWGHIAVIVIGVVVIGTGCYQLYRAVTDRHMEQIKEFELNEEKRMAFRDAGRVGLSARFVVYGIMGYFLIRTGLTSDTGKFRALGEALSFLEGGTVSSALLALVGTGLMAYGLFMFVKARYGVPS
ncbi:DUF1206 domain-containing protein [Neolewinella aurantiaca]|uniref:DUF1206 domain-containing protein n=1 Tax=Neolewinella aurantiaca TaxID=2602767 RepID=A0A5C7FLT0_9BACT|nr:DUF1206 domain-containing protein [Neolewinella aurantiaca]TXF88322.1 DUF1206 domain-containing protein [Neolewinella aurantiaca]